jgi:TPP-dependent pyruvate/acetoin dehydrogenase alpha subunit
MTPVASLAGLESRVLYRALLMPRAIEERMLNLIRQGRLSKWFSGYGQEAIAVGCAWALGARDYILPAHRNLGVWTTRGVPLREAPVLPVDGQAGRLHQRTRPHVPLRTSREAHRWG